MSDTDTDTDTDIAAELKALAQRTAAMQARMRALQNEAQDIVGQMERLWTRLEAMAAASIGDPGVAEALKQAKEMLVVMRGQMFELAANTKPRRGIHGQQKSKR